MDLGSITAAVSSLRVAGDIAKGLVSLHTITEVQSKAIDLNQAIIEAQHRIFEANASQTALVERIRELESQVARMKDWDTQKQRYDLAQPHTGCLVYALKKSMSCGEPAHYICANCYQRGERVILQHANENGWATWACAQCKSSARTGYRGPDEPQYAEEAPT